MKSSVYTVGEGASVYSGFTGGAVLNPTKLSMNARAFQTFRYTIVFFEPTETICTPQKNVSKYFCCLLRTKALSVLFYFNYFSFNLNFLLLLAATVFPYYKQFQNDSTMPNKAIIRTQEISIMTTNRKFQLHDPDYNLGLHTYDNKTWTI